MQWQIAYVFEYGRFVGIFGVIKMVFGKKAQSGIGVITAGAVLLVIVIAGIFLITAPNPGNGGLNTQTQLAHFSSYDDLLAAFTKAQNTNYGGMYRGSIGIGAVMKDAIAPMAVTNSAQETSGAGAPATSYSTTNIQVAGVDEADIIKNDGKYIYAIANNKLFIVDAYPAETANIISTVDLNGATPSEIFVSQNSDKLVVFANTYGNNYPYYANAKMMATTSMIRPWGGYGNSSVLVYNISDKATPVLEKEYDFEGSYLNSRLIGDEVYFVINSYPHYPVYYATDNSAVTSSAGASTTVSEQNTSNSGASNSSDENNIIPLMRVNGVEERIAQPTEIGIMPRVMPTSFVTIAGLNLANLELTKETVAGSADNLYASQNNLYLAEPVWDYADYNGPIPLEAGMLMKSIYFPNIGTTQKTAISKFHLENGKASFVGSGVAPGSILNQFSMDEFNDNFRIATTVSSYGVSPSGQNESTLNNNVYVFGSDMNMVGAIEGIAPNETIYSARFMGDKGYLVTFKTVDPLFVLDLSNPSDPKILGKLKIPGYSDYMQPIDETHILGIGKDVNEAIDAEKIHTPGAVYYTAVKGIKMAIFDVSDVTNPKEMYKEVIGDRGTESEALNDHKALLLDMSKNLLVLPITLVENVSAGEANGQQTFQGAYVYNISLDGGFALKGKITHLSAQDELKSGYYYGNDSQIRRSLYMDNVLYTFSSKMLKANDLTTLAEISDVNFPQEAQYNQGGYYDVPQPMMVD